MKPKNLMVPDGLIEPVATGPLDEYRKKASFDWTQLKLVMTGQEILEFQNKVFAFMKSEPLFCPNPYPQSFAEDRETAQKRLYRVMETDLLTETEIMDCPSKVQTLTCCMGLIDNGIGVKKGMAYDVFRTTIRSSGSPFHEDFVEAVDAGEATGAFCLTEIAHGTNARAMKTRATYDPVRKEFVIHTPRPEDAKCWAANIGQSCTHGLVFAQLYTPDNQGHGLHTFIVPLRDPKTLVPYPGIIIGDMGPKAGLNSVDNGFIIFNNYRIPKTNLLNKNGDVTDDGIYVSNFKDAGKKFGEQVGSLSLGRAAIVQMCVENLKKAITIGIRYAALRKQFGPEGEDEVPILEYQMHQWRLLPYLASSYVLGYFARKCSASLYDFFIMKLLGTGGDELRQTGTELHALLCAGKSVCGWLARDGIQECREACGGHGYLKVSGLSDLRNDHDANCTYEGDNNVILQQTSNFLLGLLQAKHSGVQVGTGMKSVSCIDRMDEILRHKYRANTVQEMMNPNEIIRCYEWLVCYLLNEGNKKVNSELSKGKDPFTAKNDSQVYYLRNLSIAYLEQSALKTFFEFVQSEEVPESLVDILTKLGLLYALWALDKHAGTFYQGGFFSNSSPPDHIRRGILLLCESVKPEAISLVDVIAPPDFLINSAIGKGDGELYKNLMSALLHSPGAMERPPHWRDIVKRPQLNSVSLESKL